MTTKKTEDLMKKALQRLVDALLSPCEEQPRVEAVEEALTYAGLALGHRPIDYDTLQDQMETLAAQILLDSLNQSSAVCRSIRINDEDDAAIVTTTSPVLARHLVEVIDAHTMHPPKEFNVQ
jgi:hypothetical protein